MANASQQHDEKDFSKKKGKKRTELQPKVDQADLLNNNNATLNHLNESQQLANLPINNQLANSSMEHNNLFVKQVVKDVTKKIGIKNDAEKLKETMEAEINQVKNNNSLYEIETEEFEELIKKIEKQCRTLNNTITESSKFDVKKEFPNLDENVLRGGINEILHVINILEFALMDEGRKSTWKIDNFKKKKEMTGYLRSPPIFNLFDIEFFVCADLNCHETGREPLISLRYYYRNTMDCFSHKWLPEQKIIFRLIDHETDTNTKKMIFTFPKHWPKLMPKEERLLAECTRFISHQELYAGKFIMDDTITFQMNIIKG